MVRECAIALVPIPYASSDPVCADELGRERQQSGHADQLELEYNPVLCEDLSLISTWKICRIR